MTRFLHFSCVSHVSHTHLTRNTLDHTRSRAPRLRACGPLSCAPVRLGSACRRPPTTLTMPQGCPVGESCSRYTRVGGGVAIYISMRARMWGGQIGKFLRACGAHYPLSELLHFYAFSTASAQCALLRFYTENAKLLRNLHPMRRNSYIAMPCDRSHAMAPHTDTLGHHSVGHHILHVTLEHFMELPCLLVYDPLYSTRYPWT
jgi:hypothetical protein